MADFLALRFIAIIAGTVLWDAGAVLQKKAVERLPPSRPRLSALLGSPGWMAGLVVTGIGWGLYVFGLDRVPVSAARTITGGSYVVLALFSTAFLRTTLRLPEWAAVALVTAGIVMLGLAEPGSVEPGRAASPAGSVAAVMSTGRILLGIGCIVVCAVGLYRAEGFVSKHPHFPLRPLVVFAAISGLFSSVGDLLVKVLLFAADSPAAGRLSAAAAAMPLLITASAGGLVAFYLAGFYMLSRAYQVGTMVGSIVISDFFARVGAIFLGSVALSEPLAGPGMEGVFRGIGFLLVLGGSLLLGRFSSAAVEDSRG